MQEYFNPDEETFTQAISSQRKPAVLKGLEFGDAINLWNADYLAKAVGSSPVKIHVSPVAQMDFLKKNFLYK